MKEKETFYLKHDLDARNDPKLINLRMKLGANGYGLYWMIVEKVYSENGRLARDYKALAWELHEDHDGIKRVVEDFDLFYDADGRIACRRADRDLAHRREVQKQASEAGKKSAAKRAINASSTPVQRSFNKERRGEERKGEITTGPGGPIDFSEYRLPAGFGTYAHAYVRNIPADECQFIIRTMRPGPKVLAALKWKIDLKTGEAAGRSGRGLQRASAQV